ncbi:MAG: hypothetical protein Q7T89_16315, partial [Anaerolineales bacterium]|nr:hypothetical protein [Anaerolineales bacterium]
PRGHRGAFGIKPCHGIGYLSFCLTLHAISFHLSSTQKCAFQLMPELFVTLDTHSTQYSQILQMQFLEPGNLLPYFDDFLPNLPYAAFNPEGMKRL